MSPARWLQDRPVALERAYRSTAALLHWLEPALHWIGFERLESLFEWGERVTKGPLFDCRMCGMCNLRGSGMTCPMTCPKDIRNGPCGGVRPDGKCEVVPEMDCVWVLAWERADRMAIDGQRIYELHPPVDRQLEGTSAWLNTLSERDAHPPPAWSSGIVRLEDIAVR